MTLGEALNIAKADSTKRITDGKLILGYSPRFGQFYEVEVEHSDYCVYLRGQFPKEELLKDGWEVKGATPC